ncbi:HAMP domain-containing histidine kinase [Shewanella profunda]|uniref:ATP-binding protein n=1 Tax=Shewanella profunda TaxID=254793 RepID=UPI00200E298A|nr:ATP-binding protein [Shewanella profunda]MCL1090841.1 HAMP domain-containing histidine kinase [Shewanella profunda]
MRFRLADQLNSISIKVLLAFVVGMVLSVSLITLVLVTTLLFKNNIFSELEVNDASQDLAEDLLFNAEGIPVKIGLDDDYNWLFESLAQEVAYRVLDQSGTVVFYSAAGASFWSAAEINLPLVTGSFEFERDGILMDASTGWIDHGGQRWFIQIAVSRRFIYFAHDAFGFTFLESGLTVLSVVLFIVFGACAHFTLKHTLKPLRQLSESAALISPRSLQARLSNDNVPAEIAPLVNSFNQALERLEHGYRVQQEFLATAAHELKTPLALIRAQLELMTETEERNWLLHDVSYMSRQVQQLLLLAETSEPHNYSFTVVDIKSIAEETGAYLQRMAETAKVNLIVEDYSAGSQWFADKGALFTLLKNLLENAIQHAPPNTDILIRLYPHDITVRDRGSGVTEEQFSLLFTRFWRGEHRRDLGAGLGLSICKEIALTHGWLLLAQRMEPGLLFQLSAAKSSN